MSRPSSTDEKSTVGSDPPVDKKNKSKKRLRIFNRKKVDEAAKEKDLSDSSSLPEKAAEPEVPPISFTQLFRFSTKFELFIDALGLLCAAAAGAAQPLMSLLFGNLTNEFVNFWNRHPAGREWERNRRLPLFLRRLSRSSVQLLSMLVIWFISVSVGMFVATYSYMFIWVYTGEVNAKRVREKYLQAVLRQDIAFFDNVGAGEVATRIQTDTHLVQQGISEKVALSVTFLGAFFTGFILAYIRSWRLALALSSMLPCIAITGGVMNKFVSTYMQISLGHVADGGSLAEEVISTIRTAQAFGTQKKLSAIYNTHIDKSKAVDLKAAMWHGGGLAVFFFVIYAGYGLAFHFGTTLINQGHADAGKVVNVLLSILIGSFSLALLAPEMQAITHGRGAAAKLYATIDRIPDIDSYSEEGLRPENVKGEITLEDIQFSSSRSSQLTFKAGKTAALVGASGSGKSTVINLVERFYDPTAGVVKLDGNNLKDLNLKWLRSQIGLVSQEPSLRTSRMVLIGTKWEHSSAEEKFALIKEACVKANADGFITKLPNGYETMVGERGFLLSGGQKQRIAIARAIVSDPTILLLDEATSALDTQSEGIVQDALDKAAAGRTTITIAHRLSTIKDADVIYVMGDGLVLESGTHNELLSKEGAYSRLVQSQKLRETQEIVEVDSDSEDEAEEKRETDIEKQAREEIPLGRQKTSRSLASEILEQKRLEKGEGEKEEDSRLALPVQAHGSPCPRPMAQLFLRCYLCFHDWIRLPRLWCRLRSSSTVQSVRTLEIAMHSGFSSSPFISTVAIGFQNYLFAGAAAALTARLRSLSFKAILRQDIEYFDRDENSTGALTSKLSDNPQKVNGLAGVTLGAIVQSVATVLAGSVLGLAFIWKLALVGIACTPVVISTGYIRLRVVVLKDQANRKAHEESAQLACEAAGSIRTVASLTREADCLRLYSESLDIPLKKSNRTAIWSNGLYSLSQAMVFFVIALVFWYGSRLVAAGEADTFKFFVGLMSTTFGAIQAGNVFMFVPDMSSAKGAGSDIIKLLDSTPEIDAENEGGKVLDESKVKGHIRLEGVHFRYPTRPGVRVLRDLSLEVKPGTYIALVGASGSGKSTVIQLIERFYDPLAGEVYLDGEKVTELNIQDYRKHIALVSQEPTLYAGTVRFNILLGATKPESEVTQEEIEAACRDANILEFIQSLPEGFDTEVGGKGSQLSGGQKQRIAIARALLRNPKVLLLDEATSALDSNSEKVVQAALDQAAKGRTTIAIAHRLSTIQNADTIYFIKEGSVSESGTHDQLIAKRGDYYEYVQLQALSKA
ncbi:multidrug resistance protein 1 [Ephemerocybe angulata]|uniref:Multidrug resistance protein 1 n=1 Tax=Ephemerocybe angulata TaxID=980116 RepID=A0A8H6M910_9AGAR|nr:multidrug resistance protein 1 [Tulosesus angulatus]